MQTQKIFTHTEKQEESSFDSIFYNNETKELNIFFLKEKDIEKIELLLKSGANPNHTLGKECRYYAGESILEIAISANHFRLIELLLSYKANVSKKALIQAIKNYHDSLYFKRMNPEKTLQVLKLLDAQFSLHKEINISK